VVAVGIMRTPGTAYVRVGSIAFGLVAAFAGLMLEYAALHLWLASTEVILRHGTILVKRGLPMMRRHRSIPARDVDSVFHHAARDTGVMPRYKIKLQRRDGREEILGDGILRRARARRIADRIRNALAGDAR